MSDKKNRTLAIVTGILFTAMAGVAGFAWINNMVIAMKWDPSNGTDAAYNGPFPWFDRYAVDYSTISTAIPFIGLMVLALGFFRIALAKEGKRPFDWRNFPFCAKFSAVIVNLGLIGTVIGLIMIGYYDPKNLTMNDLMIGMKTALFSTLVALVWVTIIGYPMGFFMKRWHMKYSGKEERGKDTISRVVEFGNSLGVVSDNLNETRNDVAKLRSELGGLTSEVQGLASNIKVVKEGAGTDISEIVKTSHEKFGTAITKFEAHIDVLNKENAKRQEQLNRQDGMIKKLVKDHESFMSNNVAIQQRMMGQIEQMEKRAQQSEKATQEAILKAHEAELMKKKAEEELGRVSRNRDVILGRLNRIHTVSGNNNHNNH